MYCSSALGWILGKFILSEGSWCQTCEQKTSHLPKTLKNDPSPQPPCLRSPQTKPAIVCPALTPHSDRLTRGPPTGWWGIGHVRDLPRRPKATVTDGRPRRAGEPASVLPAFVSQQLLLWIKLVYSPPPAEPQRSESRPGSCWTGA